MIFYYVLYTNVFKLFKFIYFNKMYFSHNNRINLNKETKLKLIL